MGLNSSLIYHCVSVNLIKIGQQVQKLLMSGGGGGLERAGFFPQEKGQKGIHLMWEKWKLLSAILARYNLSPFPFSSLPHVMQTF